MRVDSDELLQPDDYIYDHDGVGYRASNRPHIKWDHEDGPLLYFRNGETHGLSRREILQCWLKWDDADSLERKHRPELAIAQDGRASALIAPLARASGHDIGK
jgi:hypothetical protein